MLNVKSIVMIAATSYGFSQSSLMIDPCSAVQNGQCQNAQSAVECIKYKSMKNYRALKNIKMPFYFYSIPNSGAARYLAKKQDIGGYLAVIMSMDQRVIYSFAHDHPSCFAFLDQKQFSTNQEPFAINQIQAPALNLDEAKNMLANFKRLNAAVLSTLSEPKKPAA